MDPAKVHSLSKEIPKETAFLFRNHMFDNYLAGTPIYRHEKIKCLFIRKVDPLMIKVFHHTRPISLRGLKFET